MRESQPTRRRLLITTYHYDRSYSMESRLSWWRAQCAAQDYDVTVISARPEITPPRQRANGGGSDSGERGVKLHIHPRNRVERALMSAPGTYYFGYRLWHRRVLKLARGLHAERPFDLVHHVSFCGYREPSDGWKLGVPFIWGPMGGTQSFPRAFLGQMSTPAAAREVVRNIANAVQLRLDKRVHRAAKNAAVMLAANQSVARDLRQSLSVAPLVQLETGVETRAITRRRERDPHEPLNILWAGRLQPWKGLPLLLRALAELPAERRYRLRLMGEGPCLSRWQRLGRRLGISQNIEWIGWPEYAEQLPQYDWADVFAFTSLRDTSGTGLLEALAAGAPIVGLNHQGAADIMTESCAIRVDVSSPARAIAGFRDAIARLSLDPSLLESLRQGARERSADFSWDRQWDETRLLYEGIVSRCMPTSRSSVISSLSATAKPDALLVEA